MEDKVLGQSEIEGMLSEMTGWKYHEKEKNIGKRFVFSDFREAVAFIVRVGFEAEELDHHPEIYNVYSKVDIKLNTHSAGGAVTEKDLRLAKRIEALAAG